MIKYRNIIQWVTSNDASGRKIWMIGTRVWIFELGTLIIHDFRKYQKRLVEIMEGYIHQIKSRILVIAKTGFIVPMTKTEMASQNAGRKLMI